MATHDLNSDLLLHTYQLESELANTKKKLKFQKKQFKKIIENLSIFFDSKGISAKIIDEYITNISNKLGEEYESDSENQKYMQYYHSNQVNNSTSISNRNTHNNPNNTSIRNTKNINSNGHTYNNSHINHKTTNPKAPKQQSSNVIKLSLSDANHNQPSNNIPNNQPVSINNDSSKTNNNLPNTNDSTLNRRNTIDSHAKPPLDSIEKEPKKRRTKKAKTNTEENINILKKSSQVNDDHDCIIQSHPHSYSHSHPNNNNNNNNNNNTNIMADNNATHSQQQQPNKYLGMQTLTYPNTKKYEDIAELAQKSHQDILNDLVFQPGLHTIQDMIKQMNGIDSAELLKFNILNSANTNTGGGGNSNTGGVSAYGNTIINDDLLAYMKLLEVLPNSQSILMNDKSKNNDFIYGFLNNQKN